MISHFTTYLWEEDATQYATINAFIAYCLLMQARVVYRVHCLPRWELLG